LVLQSELPRGYKIPKFTKFAGDTSESTVEHILRYLTEAGDLPNDENLRLKYSPNSLTKNSFTWFTTLAPHSIQSWTELERLFHEQFYMGQSKISLNELASVKRNSTESIDDYLNRFILLKARCFTQVHEHELVEMAAGGLDYSIRKKLYTQHFRDMAQRKRITLTNTSSILKSLVGLPFISTDATAVVTHSKIHLHHIGGKIILSITSAKYLQSTESQTFSKSTIKRSKSFFSHEHHPPIHWL